MLDGACGATFSGFGVLFWCLCVFLCAVLVVVLFVDLVFLCPGVLFLFSVFSVPLFLVFLPPSVFFGSLFFVCLLFLGLRVWFSQFLSSRLFAPGSFSL